MDMKFGTWNVRRFYRKCSLVTVSKELSKCKLDLVEVQDVRWDLNSSPSIIRTIKSRRMRWVVHVARMGEKRDAYASLIGKPEGKRPLESPRRRWVSNIRMDLGEIGCGGVDWIFLAQDRVKWRALASAVMNFRVP
jgi:hypothetical protein